jgi:DNA-binding LytR/AlgR family response regulator
MVLLTKFSSPTKSKAKRNTMKTYQNLALSPISVGGRQNFYPEEIAFLQAEINYTKIFLMSGQFVIVATTLKKLEQRLQNTNQFIRINKTFMVNLGYVVDIQDATIRLENDLQIAFSRRKWKRFEECQ